MKPTLFFTLNFILVLAADEEVDFLFWPKCQDQKNQYSQTKSAPADANLCDKKRLSSLLSKVQVINPEAIIKIASPKDLALLCQKVEDAMKEANAYLQKCNLSPDLSDYKRLFDGVESLENTLCLDKKFRKEFEHNIPCLKKLNEDLDVCAGPMNWGRGNKAICKAYQEMVDCYFVKTSVVCGFEAAEVMKELMKKFLSSVMAVKCTSVNSETSSSSARPVATSGFISALKNVFITE